MQTFLPYPNFTKSLNCLDYRRLGKQRVEAYQILNVILNRTEKKGWRNHPIVHMWQGYKEALKLYYNTAVLLWIGRGYNNSMKLERVKGKATYPKWLGNKDFHRSHKSNLLRKNRGFYKQYKWNVPDNLPYVWIVD